MKKILLSLLIVILLASCSTYYGQYDYNRYFQNNEPYVTVDSEEEASAFIARKLARRFRHVGRQTVSVLAFTDEYGDRINRGDFFARMVVAELTRYHNPMVIERESLYELVKERELTMTNLIDNEGYELNKLLQADYILHGRILRGKHEDMISVRCFEVGTGQVVYASTISIDYTPDDIYVPAPAPVPPHGPIIIVNNPTTPTPSPQPPSTPEPEPKPTPDTDTGDSKKPTDGTQNVGKIDLDNSKKTPSDQYKYKKNDTNDKPVIKKPSSSIKPKTSSTKTTVKSKPAAVKNKPAAVIKETKQEPEEEIKEESKKTTVSSTKKKTSSIKK